MLGLRIMGQELLYSLVEMVDCMIQLEPGWVVGQKLGCVGAVLHRLGLECQQYLDKDW